jgi:DNA polymerase III subunit delta'
VPGFDDIIGQDRPLRLLATLLHKGSIPHALLFTGIAGVGKFLSAMAFAMACNCTQQSPPHPSTRQAGPAAHLFHTAGPCGRCISCRKIESGNHPDILIVRPSGAFIKIDQIRSVCDTLAMKPYEAKTRVVILTRAESMNASASNALLKVLEEPPPQTILILTAVEKSDLLPTIVSRCQHIRFNPIPSQSLEQALVATHGLDPQEAKILSAAACGSLGRALALHETGWVTRRKWLLEQVSTLDRQPVGHALAVAEHLARNKDDLPHVLELLMSWLRDLAVFKICPDKIIHSDFAAQMQALVSKKSTASVLAGLETLQALHQRRQVAMNLRLALDDLILKLAQI